MFSRMSCFGNLLFAFLDSFFFFCWNCFVLTVVEPWLRHHPDPWVGCLPAWCTQWEFFWGGISFLSPPWPGDVLALKAASLLTETFSGRPVHTTPVSASLWNYFSGLSLQGFLWLLRSLLNFFSINFTPHCTSVNRLWSQSWISEKNCDFFLVTRLTIYC